MKIVIYTFILAAFILQGYSQGFKEVKTAQDVIDNFILANGGIDNLRNIGSIKSIGKMEFGQTDIPVYIYVSEQYFYFNIDIPQFPFISSFDLKNKKGWTKVGAQIRDATEEEFNKNVDAAAAMMWKYYIDKDKYEVSYKLLQNETIKDKECFVVEFIRGENVLETVYFDPETFFRVKQIKDTQISDYSDFRNVSETGIYMPYLIKTGQGNITISSYVFNEEFDLSLLKKPKGEN